MIKILNTEQIRQADAYTILQEPISSVKLMQRAASRFVKQLLLDYPDTKIPKHIFCGSGNNGGDGLVAADILLNKGHQVIVHIIDSNNYSSDFSYYFKKLQRRHQKNIHIIRKADFIKSLPENSLIIDALLGTGLNKEIEKGSVYHAIIEALNNHKFYKVVSVDIPSGLFADRHTKGIVIQADKTYTFQFPKLSFLLPGSGKFTPEFEIIDIGLHKQYILSVNTSYYLLTKPSIAQKIIKRKKYSHKGSFGHALLVAGNYGKMGAAVLSSKACLRAGAGLVSAYIPACGYKIFQSAFPEAMCLTDKNEKHIISFPKEINYDAIAIGPGIGTRMDTLAGFEKFLKKNNHPLIVDADGLNLLSKKKELLLYLPENSILTPHPKEFERLAGKWSTDFERLAMQQNFSKKYKVILILKGAHSSISDIHGNVCFNNTGNAGMATAGSGDVLTGILCGLLAQGYNPIDAAMIAVYLHGLSADIALKHQSEESLIASDIIEHLGAAYKELKSKKDWKRKK